MDEEIGWLGLGFSSTPFDAQWRIPSFVESNRKKDASPTYQLLKQLIQTQQWRDKSAPRRRVLKVPQFMEDLDALLSVFPEARIVHVTRDPRAVVASSCSLVANQRAIQSDDVDLNEIGREWLSRTVRREATAKQRLASHTHLMVEIGYERMDSDWRSAMNDVYTSLGLGITSKTLNRMERIHSNPKARLSPHHYRLEDFGLTAGIVSQSFSSREDKPQLGALMAATH